MKFNWGTGIVVGMVLFMGFIATLSIKMLYTKIDLVDENYYELGIEHEQHMKQVRNTKALSQPIGIETNFSTLSLGLTFPKEFSNKAVKGTVLLFYPADKNEDTKYALQLNDQLKQKISLKKLKKGVWKVKLHWSCEGKDYYYEKEIVI